MITASKQSAFPTFVVKLFSELSGFVLYDAENVARFHGLGARGMNLLKSYSETNEGDVVSREGIVVPVFGIKPADYTIRVRSADSAPLLSSEPKVVSKGWILSVNSGHLCLSGIGYLTNWNPDDPRVAKLSVPSGWYRVEIHAGMNARTPVIEFVLERTDATPLHFCGDVGAPLNFYFHD